jgi:hypothetical protein
LIYSEETAVSKGQNEPNQNTEFEEICVQLQKLSDRPNLWDLRHIARSLESFMQKPHHMDTGQIDIDRRIAKGIYDIIKGLNQIIDNYSGFFTLRKKVSTDRQESIVKMMQAAANCYLLPNQDNLKKLEQCSKEAIAATRSDDSQWSSIREGIKVVLGGIFFVIGMLACIPVVTAFIGGPVAFIGMKLFESVDENERYNKISINMQYFDKNNFPLLGNLSQEDVINRDNRLE